MLLLTQAAVSQNDFPAPYCDIEDTTVEPITSVEFADTTISNSDSNNILIDKTDTVVTVSKGETYSITVKGNTEGNFDNSIVAFFDWNQNYTLNDENEVYELGLITNSTGDDDVYVTMEITIPEDAELGETRVRITKTYTDEDSVAEVNPCAIEMDIMGMGAFPGFGQAIDFTVLVEEALDTPTFEAPSVTIFPNPTANFVSIASAEVVQTITLYNMLGQKVYTSDFGQSSVTLDLSSLKSGQYLAKVKTETGTTRHRILRK